ncbi:hypothetical protein FOA52_014813 [Chlamydomonas sp. UWO 241]|nr:hypothetical protein FOA52_014813 [Chlamydomonas sp. UWO 241]
MGNRSSSSGGPEAAAGEPKPGSKEEGAEAVESEEAIEARKACLALVKQAQTLPSVALDGEAPPIFSTLLQQTK